MRPSTTSCRPPRPERRRTRRRPEALASLALLPLVLAGCVSLGTHRAVVEERDRLQGELKLAQERVRLLEASNESLSQERVKLVGEVEDLRTARQQLDEQVQALDAHRQELEENLAKREAELAARGDEVQSLRSTYDGLVQDLQSEVAEGRVQIERLAEGLRVNLSQEVLFPSGSAQLSAGGRNVISRVAARLRQVDQRVDVQGHTDDVPISGALASRYPSNWELAGARAASVVRLLQQQGVPSNRLTAVSYGDTRPVASNDTAEGRARNRRIEIRLRPIHPGSGDGGEEQAEAPAAPAP